MKIGVDAREIQDGVVTGIGRSLVNFIGYFAQRNKKHTLVLFSEKNIPIDFRGNIERVTIKPSVTFIWDQWKLPRHMRAHEIDLFYSPYYKIPVATKILVVNQILDLMFLVFPYYRKKLGVWKRFYYSVFGKKYARKAVSIITDSQHAKQDIIRIWNIDPEKIKVFPLGVASRYQPVRDTYMINKTRNAYNLPERFILYLGNFKPHKNVESLIHAFYEICNRFPDYKLVLAGPMDSFGRKMKSLVLEKGIQEKVVFTGTVKEEDHPEALYSLAELFVFPTLYEGFGLPPLEAMACGTPVIASNRTAVPEVVGEAGILVNPEDIEELSNAIADLLADPSKREILSKKGLERAKLFKEDKTAGKIYRHLVKILEDLK
ncbi:MAG: glycosyltransferase family 4 protein [Candidatus Aminicenantaceae bacterium]